MQSEIAAKSCPQDCQSMDRRRPKLDDRRSSAELRRRPAKSPPPPLLRRSRSRPTTTEVMAKPPAIAMATPAPGEAPSPRRRSTAARGMPPRKAKERTAAATAKAGDPGARSGSPGESAAPGPKSRRSSTRASGSQLDPVLPRLQLAGGERGVDAVAAVGEGGRRGQHHPVEECPRLDAPGDAGVALAVGAESPQLPAPELEGRALLVGEGRPSGARHLHQDEEPSPITGEEDGSLPVEELLARADAVLRGRALGGRQGELRRQPHAHLRAGAEVEAPPPGEEPGDAELAAARHRA